METASNSAEIENQKILRVLRLCKAWVEQAFKKIKLRNGILKIVQELTAVHFALAQANLAEPQANDWTKRQ